MKPIYLLFALLFATSAAAQSQQARIIDNNLISVQLHLAGAPLTLPIVELKCPNNALILEFDHLGTDVKNYLYTIQHCNSNWEPSDMVDNEYIDGFTEDRITELYNSFNTLTTFTHYTLALPNRNMRWSKSGNYLLKVFDDDNDKQLVLVRRFMVVEPQWLVTAEFVKPAKVQKLNTHHEIDFKIGFQNTRVQSPLTDVKAFVLQNGRWDNAIGPLRSNFIRSNELVFDYQDSILFPAGKEWRFFDMRSMEHRADHIKNILRNKDYYDVTLFPDESRSGRAYLYHGDLNGRFSIENTNYNQSLAECDYAEVLVSIERNQPEPDADVYVFGELSDWQYKPEFKMKYDEEAKVYYCQPFLKQGYYNYQYAVVGRKTGLPDEDGFEGNWYETGNQYTILVYFHPFGERYDRLMCAASLSSGRQ